MRINWDTPMEELYHSDNIAYIDLDEDEICHWKYIKREKLPNGKWRYFYDQSELDQYKMLADKTRMDAWKSAANVINKRSEYRLAKQTKNTKGAKKAKQNLKSAKKNRKSAVKNAETAKKVYEKKKVSTFAARTIAKGAVIVANFFSGANRKPKIKKPKKKKVSRVTYSSSVSLKSVR